MKLIRDKTVSAGKHAGAEEMDSKWGQGREEKWTDDTSHERGLLVEPRRIVKISVVFFFFSLSLSNDLRQADGIFFHDQRWLRPRRRRLSRRRWRFLCNDT